MPIVVDQSETPAPIERDLAIALEPAAHALELRQRARDRPIIDADLAADGDGRERVLDVVHAGEIEIDRECGPVGRSGDEAHAPCCMRYVGRAQLRILRES